MLTASSKVAVLTGAGISSESGIPTFRSNGGFWQKHRFEDLATPQAFARDPKFVWTWYEERRRAIAGALPNRGHHALVELEKRVASLTLITQNVDGLHDAAGSRNIVRLHGDIWNVRCVKCGVARIDRSELNDLPPYCACGGLLRPGVVWFGERLPQGSIERAAVAVREADVLLVVGTSAQVFPAAGLIPLAKAAVEINPEETAFSSGVTYSIRGSASEVLPRLVAEILN